MPRLVHPPLPFSPHKCLATNREEGEFIDFESDANINEPFPRVVLLRNVVEEAARECCGMVSGEEVAEVRRQMAELSEKLEETLKDVGLLGNLEARFGKELEAGITPGMQVEAASPAGDPPEPSQTDPTLPVEAHAASGVPAISSSHPEVA